MGRTVTAITNMIDESFADGTLDADNLHEIKNHIHDIEREARRSEGRRVAAALMPGSEVRISPTAALCPRYILGTHATVVRINQTSATITLGEVRGGSGRFYTGQEIRCPLDALELVEGS
jgi:hypothetical protein